MTMQAEDYFYIGKKKYTLIDIEKNKQIITCANFNIPEEDEIISHSTACWRGYTAKYYVLRRMLYGIKYPDIDDIKQIKSYKIFIPYTGSCIIAYGDGGNSDFLETYLDYDEAFELYFENGVLKEKNNLISAIERARSLEKTDEYENKLLPIQRRDIRLKIALEPLKYQYNRSTYKWRNNNSDDDDDGDDD